MIGLIQIALAAIGAGMIFWIKPWESVSNSKLVAPARIGTLAWGWGSMLSIFMPMQVARGLFGFLEAVAYAVVVYPLLLAAVAGAIYMAGRAVWVGLFGGELPSLFSLKTVQDTHMRGATLATDEQVSKLTAEHPSGSNFKLGNVAFPREFEPLNILAVGRPGVGKSLLNHQAMSYLRPPNKRGTGERAIVVDPGGDYMRKYFREGDIILNPDDARSALWSPLSEISKDAHQAMRDCARLATLIIPDGEGANASWHQYAQVVLTEILKQLARGEVRYQVKTKTREGVEIEVVTDYFAGTNKEFYQYVCVDPTDTVEARMGGTPAARIYEATGMKTSTQGILGANVADYQLLNPNAGKNGFSITEWVTRKDDESWIWIPFKVSDLASTKRMIATWLAVAMNALLSLDTDLSRRVWFFIDEAHLIGKIQGFVPFLTNARKKGAVAMISYQENALLEDIYGKLISKALRNCMATWCIFASPDKETANDMAGAMGESEVERKNRSGGDNGGTWSKQIAKSQPVIYTEIQKLEKFNFFLRLPEAYSVCKTKVPFNPDVPDVAQSFVPKTYEPKPIPVIPVDDIEPLNSGGLAVNSAVDIEMENEAKAGEISVDDLLDMMDGGNEEDGKDALEEVKAPTSKKPKKSIDLMDFVN